MAKKPLLVLLGVLSALLGIASVAFFIAAIWVSGPNSERLAGTGVITAILAFMGAFAIPLVIEAHDGAQ